MSLWTSLRRISKRKKIKERTRRTRRAPIRRTSPPTIRMVDAEASKVEEDSKEEAFNKVAEAFKEEASKVGDSRQEDSIIRVSVSEEEAVAMTNTIRAVIVAPLQPTRLDSQDGMDITTSKGTMIRDHFTLTKDGIDNQLTWKILKDSCLIQSQH